MPLVWVSEPRQGMPGWRRAGQRHSDATARAIPQDRMPKRPEVTLKNGVSLYAILP